jgi:hypothetical protein
LEIESSEYPCTAHLEYFPYKNPSRHPPWNTKAAASSFMSYHRRQATPPPPELCRLEKKHHQSPLVLPRPSVWLDDQQSFVLIEVHRAREQAAIASPRRCLLEPFSPRVRIPVTTALFCTDKSTLPHPIVTALLTLARTSHGATELCPASPPTPLSRPCRSSPRQRSRIDQGIPIRWMESWPLDLKGMP